MWVQLITAPLVGGLIGLVTNGIAVKMIFRPLKPVYIGRFRLPFTPGLIPKERSRIARAIGDTISKNLLNEYTFKATLLSEAMKNQIYTRIDNVISKYTESDEKVRTVLERLAPGINPDDKITPAAKSLAATITKKAVEQDIGAAIADYAYNEIISKTTPVLRGLTGTALNSIKQPFAAKINSMISEKAEPIVEKFLEEQAADILNTPIKDLIVAYKDSIPQFKEGFWKIYGDVVNSRLESVLAAVDISAIINDRINQLELLEMEKIITTLARRELNALIYLGGLLGIVMGFLNVAFELLF